MAKFQISISDKGHRPLKDILTSLSLDEIKSLEECFSCIKLHVCTLTETECCDYNGHCKSLVSVSSIFNGGERFVGN